MTLRARFRAVHVRAGRALQVLVGTARLRRGAAHAFVRYPRTVVAELIVALGPLLLLMSLALVALLVPLKVLAIAALVLTAIGWLVGLPSGLYYHVALRRELVRVGKLPRGWYWHPQRHHALLDHAALRRLRPWFMVGALGFMLIVAGCALALTALALWFRDQGQVLAWSTMSASLRIGFSLGLVLLVASLVAWYVGKRATWAFGLSRPVRRAMGVTIALGFAAAVVSRMLDWEHATLGYVLGAFGGTTLLGVVISSVMLLPVDLARLVLYARRGKSAAPPAADVAASSARTEAPASAPHEDARAETPALPARRDFLVRAAAGSAITFGMGASIYGTLLGRHDYTLETVPIRLAKLPKALDGLTIVQLSDIHVGTFVGERELSAALDLVQSARADLVVMTGDLLDHDLHYAPVLARFARALQSRARYGVFAIPGNHDHYAGAPTVLRLLREAGTEVLLNRHVQIGDAGGRLLLAGLDDVAGPGFMSPGPQPEVAFAGASPDLARVLLSHNPVYFAESRTYADLTLSGHTHGGQITLFINPAELVLSHGLVRGHYHVGESQLYVNRGFGTAGPPSRIGSPPEVTKLVLTS